MLGEIDVVTKKSLKPTSGSIWILCAKLLSTSAAIQGRYYMDAKSPKSTSDQMLPYCITEVSKVGCEVAERHGR